MWFTLGLDSCGIRLINYTGRACEVTYTGICNTVGSPGLLLWQPPAGIVYRILVYHERMFKWFWKICFLLFLAGGFYFFRFSLEKGELIIRLRSSGDREEIADKAKDAAKSARELAGKVRFESTKEKTKKVIKTGKKVAKVADKVHENLDNKDRKALQDVLDKELK